MIPSEEFKRRGFTLKGEYWHKPYLDIDYCFKWADFRKDYGLYIEYTDSPFPADNNKLYPVAFGFTTAEEVDQLMNILIHKPKDT